MYNPATQYPAGIYIILKTPSKAEILRTSTLPISNIVIDSPNIFDTTISKYFSTQSSETEIKITLKATIMQIDNLSRIIIIFPSYYLLSLNKNGALSCYY